MRAPRGAPQEPPSPESGSASGPFVARVADWCTIGGVAVGSMSAVEAGLLSAADGLLGLAAFLRVLQLFGPGIDFREVRRYGFLLGVLGVFTVGGVLSGVANGDPLAWDFIRIVIATLGSVLVVATYATNAERLHRLLRVFCLGGTALAISGFVMAAPDGGRAVGLSIHPNGLGHSLMLSIMASIYLVEQSRDRRARLFWLGAIVLQLAALMDSGSRGSFVGLGVGLFLYLLLSADRRVVLAGIAVAYLVAMVSFTGMVHLPENNPISRFSSEGGGSNQDREIQLDNALAKVREDPLFGEGFRLIILVHVVYLQGWVGAGALGVIALVGLGLAFVVWPFFQTRRTLVLACALTAIGVAWLFTNALTLRDQWLFLAIVFRMTASPLSALNRREAATLDPLEPAGAVVLR